VPPLEGAVWDMTPALARDSGAWLAPGTAAEKLVPGTWVLPRLDPGTSAEELGLGTWVWLHLGPDTSAGDLDPVTCVWERLGQGTSALERLARGTSVWAEPRDT